MNNILKNRSYKIPDEILNYIENYKSKLDKHYDGFDRANFILKNKILSYNTLKRILHDLKYIDKQTENIKYNLWGGDLMFKWVDTLFKNERSLLEKNKKFKEKTNELGGIDGIRKNAHNKKHEKSNLSIPKISNNFSINKNDLKLFEELEKIKHMIKYDN